MGTGNAIDAGEDGMSISNELKKIAKHLHKWEPHECFQGEDGECFVWWGLHDQPQFCHPNSDTVKNRACFTKDQWLQARKDLGLDPSGISEADEEECIQLAYERMNEGSIPTSIKQLRYQDAKGEDWIDEFARTASVDEFRGAMKFTIGKYNRRAGKKDELIKEIKKMRDYCDRWIDYERSL